GTQNLCFTARRQGHISHSEAADDARGSQILIEMGRRDAEDAGDVVEPIARVVLREQRGVVEPVEIEEVANRGLTLDAIQAVKALRASRIRMLGRGLIELALDEAAERRVGRQIRTRVAERGHRPGAKLLDDLFEARGGSARVAEIDALQRQV